MGKFWKNLIVSSITTATVLAISLTTLAFMIIAAVVVGIIKLLSLMK